MESRAYSAQVGSALQFASEVHAGQRRKGKEEPYLSHVLRVAGMVAHHGGDEEQIIAAALHDAAEDHGGEDMLSEIESRFGSRVAGIVRDCSDALVPEGVEKPDWRTRKQSFLHAVAERGASPSTLVQACDKLSNLEDIIEDLSLHGERFLTRFRGGADGVRWYYSEVGRVLIPLAPASLQSRYSELLDRLLAEAGVATSEAPR